MFVVEMRAERARLPGATPVVKAMNYMLDRWPSFARFLDDGRVCISNNSSERALRGLATAVSVNKLRTLTPPPTQTKPLRSHGKSILRWGHDRRRS